MEDLQAVAEHIGYDLHTVQQVVGALVPLAYDSLKQLNEARAEATRLAGIVADSGKTDINDDDDAPLPESLPRRDATAAEPSGTTEPPQPVDHVDESLTTGKLCSDGDKKSEGATVASDTDVKECSDTPQFVSEHPQQQDETDEMGRLEHHCGQSEHPVWRGTSEADAMPGDTNEFKEEAEIGSGCNQGIGGNADEVKQGRGQNDNKAEEPEKATVDSDSVPVANGSSAGTKKKKKKKKGKGVV
eukprot:scaffold1033_cov408-Prasinococcus_capsulatus_cf.AAC.11